MEFYLSIAPAFCPGHPACTQHAGLPARGHTKGFSKLWVEGITSIFQGSLAGGLRGGFRRKNVRCWSQAQLGSSLGSAPHRGTSNKSCHLLGPRFPHLQSSDSNTCPCLYSISLGIKSKILSQGVMALQYPLQPYQLAPLPPCPSPIIHPVLSSGLCPSCSRVCSPPLPNPSRFHPSRVSFPGQ